jgi:aerobic carbon-monoxide dehydrogenase medium subunit
MHRFDYHTPGTLAEAVALLDGFGDTARIIAGGTDLLTALKEHWETPDHVVDLRCVSGLDRIAYDPSTGLTIGARATVRAVETSPLVQHYYPALASAASTLASIQIRNLATLAGNICRASPSADMPPVLLALGASVTACSPAGERTISLDDFFTGPGRTVLSRNEILTAIHLPPVDASPGRRAGAAYIKHSPRRAMDLATVGVAAAVTVERGWITSVRIALGAVAPTPRRARRAESVLLGRQVAVELLHAAGEAAAAECAPISDVRGTAGHRRAMVAVLTRRALEQAIAAALVEAEVRP